MTSGTAGARSRGRAAWRVATIAALALGLAACGKGKAVQCTAASAQAPVVDIVKEHLEHSVSRALRGNNAGGSLSKIRAAIAQLVVTIEDIRTSKEDPNSTKRFCTGTLRIRFPADALADADRAREAANLNSVSDLADSSDVERHADSFTSTIEFNVQPTDDGSKVFAETESGNNMFDFASELLSSSLMRAAVEDQQRQQQAAADQATADQNAALAEQRDANLSAAKTENQLAVQTINAVWKALSPGTRSQLMPLQRAWVRKKTADCAVEAASASTDPTDRETARLQCDTRAENERVNYLNGMRGSDQGFGTEMPMANEGED